jgi:hypothetical protein
MRLDLCCCPPGGPAKGGASCGKRPVPEMECRACRPGFEPVIDYGGCVQLRYSFRLYPAPGQQVALARAFGCARVVFNDGLAARRPAHEAGKPWIGDAELSARLTYAKKSPERAWLGEVSSVVLQQALADLNAAYRNFFVSMAGKRKGARMAPPRFRSRKDRRQAIRFTRNSRFAVLGNGRLRLPKIGDVEVRWSRELPAAPSSVTVIRDAAGRFFASFVVGVTAAPLPPTGAECGIDLGLGHFAVLDDGTKVAAPRFLRRAEKKLRRAHKDLSRTKKGSGNREKARVQVARAHAKVADARRDFHHNRPVRANQPAVLGLRREGRAEAAAHPAMAVPRMRCRPRPGHQRRKEHPRPGTQGEAKRPWRRCETTACGGSCQRSGKPQRCRITRHGLNHRP